MRRRVKPGTAKVRDRCGVTRKARFASEPAALRALDACQRAAREEGERKRREQRAYKCWYCQGWHLTSQQRAS